MQAPQSTSFVRGWTFRILLLVGALAGFLDVAATIEHRLEVSTFGIPAAVKVATKSEKLPATWSDLTGRAMFFVKIKPDNGSEFSADLYLSRAEVEPLLRGETLRIVFADGNPRRFIMQGTPLPPISFVWLTVGFASLALFFYSLRLR